MRYFVLFLALLFLFGCAKQEKFLSDGASSLEKISDLAVQNEEIIGDSEYYAELVNNGNVEKNCSIALEINANGEISRINKDIGIIKPNSMANFSIEFGFMPEGSTSFKIIPTCK